MSISTTSTKDSYAGNASTDTPYQINFKYLEESHVSVYIDGVLQTKGAGADYVMGGDGTTNTGYITTNVAQADTKTITIVLDVPFDQPVDLQETGVLSSSTLEEAYDRLNMQIRRVWRKVGGVLTFSTDEAGSSTGTADTLVGFDDAGDLGEIPNSKFCETANNLSDVDAATARANLGVDASGTDPSTDVTLAGTGTYLSINGQVITVDEITESDISDLGSYIEDVTGSPLSDLQDVTITTPASGEVLSWNGSAWVNTLSGNGDALTTSGLDQFASTTSAEFAGVISDKTGTGSVVLATSPTLVTPALGTPSAVDLTNATNTPLPATGTVTEAMLNTSANLSLDKANTSMQPATYDPTTVAGDAFDSANHAYTPAGTGAVDTDVETKLREGVSVKDYGAVGNGVADDTAEIQAAIDSVSAAGGGTIHFPAGTYNINGATGIDLETGVKIKGEGMGKTIVKNVVNNWRYVFGCLGGDDIGIEDMTIDGDWSNLEPVDVNTDSNRGEGVIMGGAGSSDLNRLMILNVEVKNTGHYGIGLQSVNIVSGTIRNVHFENIGGDCIDVKSSGAPLSGTKYNKALIIDGVFTSDGCGHNNTGFNDNGHNNQAVVDVGGKVLLSNVHINGLDSYGTGADTQIGNVGVRFRAPVLPSRNGSAGSVANNIYISSVKLDSEGSGTEKRITGVQFNDGDITLNNVYVENCYWGIRLGATTDGRPLRNTITNAHVKNCRGASGDGLGISASGAAKSCIISGQAQGCDTGANINGAGHIVNLMLNDNTLGIKVEDSVIRQGTFNLKFQDNLTATDNQFVDPATGMVVGKILKVAGNRTAGIDIVSLANDTGWTAGENRYMGKLNFVTNEDSGHGSGTRALIGARMTGDTGGSSDLQIAIENGSGLEEIMVINQDSLLFQKPARLPSFSTANLPADAPEGSLAYDSTLNKLSIKTGGSGGWQTVTST